MGSGHLDGQHAFNNVSWLYVCLRADHESTFVIAGLRVAGFLRVQDFQTMPEQGSGQEGQIRGEDLFVRILFFKFHRLLCLIARYLQSDPLYRFGWCPGRRGFLFPAKASTPVSARSRLVPIVRRPRFSCRHEPFGDDVRSRTAGLTA